MKIRIGFVSNSSSASFCIPAYKLTEKQIDKIRNHFAYAKEQVRWYQDRSYPGRRKDSDRCHYLKSSLGWWPPGSKSPVYQCKTRDMWEIFREDGYLCGGTNMTNFRMSSFLKAIGVSSDHIYWFDTCGYSAKYLIEKDLPIIKSKIKIKEEQIKLEQMQNS